MEYPHERAVADGVNVPYDVYRIETKSLMEAGGIEPPSENGRCSGLLQAQPVFWFSPTATPQAGYLQASPVEFRKMLTGRSAPSYPVCLTPFPSPRASSGGRRCAN